MKSRLSYLCKKRKYLSSILVFQVNLATFQTRICLVVGNPLTLLVYIFIYQYIDAMALSKVKELMCIYIITNLSHMALQQLMCRYPLC